MKRFLISFAGLFLLAGGGPLLAQVTFPSLPSLLQINQTKSFTFTVANTGAQCDYTNPSFTSNLSGVTFSISTFLPFPSCTGTGTVTAGTTAGTASIIFTGDLLGISAVSFDTGSSIPVYGIGQITLAATGSTTVQANASLVSGTFVATVYDTESPHVAIPNVTVTFATSAGIGTSAPGGAFPAAPGNMVATSGAGTANSPLLTVDSVPGTFTVTASALAASSPTATVTIVPATPSTIQISAGSNQSTNAGNAFATNLQVSVKDAYGNPATSGTVTFTAPSSGPRGTFAGSSPPSTATVNVSAGIATAPILTAGNTAGAFQVTATLNSGSSPSVMFNLAVAAGLPASITATAGSGQSAAVNSQFATLLSATVTDGNTPPSPVQYAIVTFSAPTTGASVLFNGASSVTVQTNASGVATVPSPMTANGVLGNYSATATVSGVAQAASFALTNTAGTPAKLSIAGGAQSTVINTAFSTPVTATVTDGSNNPVANATVTFSVATLSGGATATFAGTASATTNSAGVATAPVLTAGMATGTLNVTAAVTGTSLSATTTSPLIVTAGSPANIAITAGNSQTVSVGGSFTTALAVKITDSGGNPVPSVTVVFATSTVTGGANGSFSGSATVTTSTQGIATAPALTGNNKPGVFNVSATAGSSPVLVAQFTENISTGTVSTVTITGGNNQTATVNTLFAQSLQVQVTDSGGNPVAGAPVIFTAPAGGASAKFTTTNTVTVTSDSTGKATTPVTAGAVAGGYTVTVTAGSPAVTASFALTNQVGPPSSIAIQSGNNQGVPVTMNFAALKVQVLDSGGNAVMDGASVSFMVSPCSNSAASASFTGKGCTDTETTTNGVASTSATLTANSVPGAFVVTVTAGAASATFSLSNLAGSPASIVKVSGDNQSATINKQFPNTFQVQVLDGGGNPVANTPVTFSAPTSGAGGTFAGNPSVLANASGTATSPVFTANGTSGSYTVTASAGLFSASFSATNLPVLTVTSVTPSSASESSALDQNLTLAGTGFVMGDIVQFVRPSISSTPLTLTSTNTGTSASPATSIAATIPKADLAVPIGGTALTTPETDSITVMHPDGTSASVTFTVNPPPTATSVSPTSVNVGNSNFILTINGNNFNSGASVIISSAATSQNLVPSAINPTSITVNLPPAILTTFAPAVAGAASSIPLNVVVQDGGSTTTLTSALTLLFPSISGLNPTSVASGGPMPFTLTVNGTNFVSNSVVHWCGSGTGCTPGNGDTPLTTTLTTNSSGIPILQASVPAALTAQAGSATVTVVNAPAFPTQTLSNQILFNFGGLQLNSISPITAQAGSAATTISVTGANFQPDAVVHFVSGNQDTPLVTTTIMINGAISTTQLSATIPAALLSVTGTASISVVNVADQTRSNALAFNVVQSAITSLSQSNAAAGTPGLTLVVNGTNFVSGLTVQWTVGGTSTPLTPSQVNATQVTVVIPAALLATAGTAQIAVMNSGAISSNSVPFTINNPTITALLPTSAQLNAPTFQLSVAGTDFLNGSIVQWNDGTKVTQLSTTFTGPTQLTALITPALLAVSETVVITVLNPGIGSPAPISNAVPFSVGPSPTILPISAGGLSPSTAPAGSPSFTLTVTGTNFTSTSVVVWDPGSPGTPTKLTTYLSDPVNFTTVTATVPASLLSAQGTATITVQNTGPVVSNPVQFVITAGATPTITNLTPNSSTAGVSVPVQMTITGSSFQSGATVQWNGTGGTTMLTPVFVSAGQLNVTVPITLFASAGTASVTVTNPGGGVSNTATFTINPPNQVAITSLQISMAAAGSGTLVDTITGQFFVPGSTVQWNNGAATTSIATQFVNSTTLTAVIPASDLAMPGIAFVSVQNPDKTVSNTLLFTIAGALPTITSLSQTSAPAGTAAFSLTVTGTGYTAAGTTVLWGTTPLPTLVNSATQLTVTVTADLLATAGTVSVSVQTAGGTSNTVAFTIGGPTILVLAPNSATVGTPGLTLSVGGQNFITGATVMWATTALTTTFVSSSQLSAVVPASLLAAPGAINVTVQNPGGAASAPSPFSVGTGPAVASVSPTTATAGSGAFTLTVTGSNFASGDQILWNGVPLTTTFSSATQLSGAVPANLTSNADTINIEVLHTGGVLSNLLQFVLAGPTITSIAPTVAPAGSASVQITVTGANFIQQSIVQWNATAIPTAFVNATTLTAQVGSALLQNPGAAFLTVTNGSSASAPTTFAVVAPSLSSISPGTAVAGTGALSLTLTGANFASGSTVNWNGTQLATAFTSSTQLTAVVPANLTALGGTNIVTVTNPGGSTSGLAVFILSTPPPAAITSFSPSSAIAGSQAFILSVAGTGFNSTSTVVWNGSTLPTTFVSATQVTAFVNSTLLALQAQANVTVQNSGAAASVPAVFPVNGPTIASLSPSTTSAGGPAFNLSVTGTNYLPGSLIQWNSVSLPTAYNNPTTLTASVPASLVTAAGAASVTVQNPGGATSPASAFTIGPFTLSFTTVSLPDAIVGQIYAAPALQATGGTSPYSWSITGGVIPQGLTLDPTSGTITGTATAPGLASLTITVTDSVGRSVSKTLALHAVLPLTITNAATLPAAAVSSAYSLLLVATGGTPPYTWSAGGGSLPTGLLLNSTSGQMSGTPLVPGLSQFTISVTDSRSLSLAAPFSLTTTLQSVTIGGVTSSLAPAQQPSINLSLGGPYTVSLSGYLNLAFASAVGGDDQSIQFSSGGRQVAFTLPAGTTQPLFGQGSSLMFTTGTVAGNLTISATVNAGTANVTPSPAPSQTGTVAKGVPVLTAASLTRITGGVNISITGYSTTREMTSATVTFNPATGSTITSAPITVQLANVFTTWYSSPASTAVGSMFTITLPFTVSGNTAAIGSATVIMTNSQGPSQPITAMP